MAHDEDDWRAEMEEFEQERAARGIRAPRVNQFGGMAFGATAHEAYLSYLESDHDTALSEVDMEGPAVWNYPGSAYLVEAPGADADHDLYKQGLLDARVALLEDGVPFALIYPNLDIDGVQRRGRRGLIWQVVGLAQRIQKRGESPAH
jgi:hypothetical protein